MQLMLTGRVYNFFTLRHRSTGPAPTASKDQRAMRMPPLVDTSDQEKQLTIRVS
jgi:hypothetical protein